MKDYKSNIAGFVWFSIFVTIFILMQVFIKGINAPATSATVEVAETVPKKVKVVAKEPEVITQEEVLKIKSRKLEVIAEKAVIKEVSFNVIERTSRNLGHGVVIDSWKEYTGSNRYLEKILKKRKKNLEIIKKISIKEGVEWVDMIADGVIESHLGSSNICNEGGYCGVYQFGKAAWKAYGHGSRLNIVSSTKAAIKYRAANRKRLSKVGIPVSGFTLYLAHQQGSGGVVSIYKIINGDPLKRKEKRRLAIALCSNIPLKIRTSVCYSIKKKGRTLWRKNRSVPLKDVANIHFFIWSKEYEEIKEKIKQLKRK